MGRKRSVVWRFFKPADEEITAALAVRCLICGTWLIKGRKGTTSTMLRHLRLTHPKYIPDSLKENMNDRDLITFTSKSQQQQLNAGGQESCSVEVVLEDEDAEDRDPSTDSTMNDTEEKKAPREYGPHCSSRPRSLVWKYFRRLEGLSVAQCHICMKKIKRPDGGTTSNLHRHISKKHPEVSSQLASRREKPAISNSFHVPKATGDAPSPPGTDGATDQRQASEDGGSEPITEVHKATGTAEIFSTMNGRLEAAQRGPREQTQHEEMRFAHVSSRTRSLIWKYFRRLEGFTASQCQICMRKIKCPDKGTSNLHRHISKKHPEVFSQLLAQRQKPTLSNSSQVLSDNGDRSTPPDTDREVEQRGISASGAFDRETHAFRTERDLIEALRRAQKAEAQALEQQRELLEKLRVVNQREAAAEKEQIQSLRKAQEEEAKGLSRQREELQKEKAELREKWEELRQEREQFLVFSSGQQAS